MLLSLSTYAQPPVLTASTNYLIGDIFIQHLVDADTFVVGGIGPGQFWFAFDFPLAADTEYYTICSASTYCDSFPGTTICGQKLLHGSSVFYNETAAALSVTGIYDTTLTVYSNYMDILRYPFTYGSAYTDTFAAQYIKGGIIYHRYGTINVTGIAYGKMVNWNDTFNNTLGVYSIKSYFDSTAGLGVVDTYIEESYQWYVPGYRDAFRTEINKTINGVRTLFMFYFNNEGEFTTSVPIINLQSSIELYPSQATTSLTIKSVNEPINKITITNLLGQTVYSHLYNFSPQVLIDISDLPIGLYILKANNNEVKRFIKQ